MNNNFVTYMPVQTFDGVDLTGVFQVIDANGFPGALRYIRIVNITDEPVMISFDGKYGNEFIFANDDIDLNVQLCKSPTNKRSLFRNKTKIYIKTMGGIPKGGGIVVEGWYQN